MHWFLSCVTHYPGQNSKIFRHCSERSVHCTLYPICIQRVHGGSKQYMEYSREKKCSKKPRQPPQSTQSAGPVRFLIFCSVSISLLASLVAGRDPSVLLVQISWECTPSYLFTGISNLLQPAQAEVVLGHLSTYLASWATPSPSPIGFIRAGCGSRARILFT
jgi:hypothetical protein